MMIFHLCEKKLLSVKLKTSELLQLFVVLTIFRNFATVHAGNHLLRCLFIKI